MGAIQEKISSNWNVPTIANALSKEINRNKEMANGIMVKRLATYLIIREESPGTRVIIIAPTIGIKIMVVR